MQSPVCHVINMNFLVEASNSEKIGTNDLLKTVMFFQRI